jgi:hypothetical protein
MGGTRELTLNTRGGVVKTFPDRKTVHCQGQVDKSVLSISKFRTFGEVSGRRDYKTVGQPEPTPPALYFTAVALAAGDVRSRTLTFRNEISSPASIKTRAVLIL